jgi:hypothetical protein
MRAAGAGLVTVAAGSNPGPGRARRLEFAGKPAHTFMTIPTRLLALTSLILLGLNVRSQDTNRLVFLCFGQSNMEGFPGIEQQDKGNDGHGSKVIVVPFDGAAIDRDLQSAAASTKP